MDVPSENLRQKQPSVEAAWRSYRDISMPPGLSDEAKLDIRTAFWAGATVLFTVMMNMLDPGEDPTDADLGKMQRLSDELDRFAATFDELVYRRHGGRQ